MNPDNKKKNTADETTSEPPLKNYQEESNADKELQKALDEVPVKDYSDYEITVEARDHYEDALFSDDDSLEQALHGSKPEPQAEKHATDKSPSLTPEHSTEKKIEVDYRQFLTTGSQSGSFALNTETTSVNTQLIAIDGQLNSSIPAESTAITSSSSEIVTEAISKSKQDKKTTSKKSQPLKNLFSRYKEQFNEYYGRNLPERVLPLDFKFSALKPKKDFESLVSPYEINKLLSVKGKQLSSLLKQAEQDLATLTKCQLSNRARLQILDSYAPSLIEKIATIKGIQGKKPPFPHEEKRAAAAEYAQLVIKHLLTAYKQVYCSIYELANHHYGPQRKKANAVAFRIVELLCLEQNLLNVLHRPLPPGSAKTFNKIFHALSRYEPQTIEAPCKSLVFDTEHSIKAMFLRYQVLLSFEMMTLSPSLNKLLNQYLLEKQGTLTLLPPGDWNVPPSYHGQAWMINHDNTAGPVLTSTANTDRFTAIFIETSAFFNQIKTDYKECLSLIGTESPSHSSIALRGVAIQHSLSLMIELNRYIRFIETRSEPPSYSSFQPSSSKVYSGFSNSFAWLNHFHSKLNQKTIKTADNTTALPKQPSPGTTPWLSAMEDGETLYLQTSEQKGTPPLDIGYLLLMITLNEEGEEKALLSRITKVERLQPGTINVVVQKLGQQSTSVVIKYKNNGKVPGIISQQEGHYYLIVNHAEAFCSGETFEIILPDQSCAIIKIKGLKSITQQIQLLELE